MITPIFGGKSVLLRPDSGNTFVEVPGEIVVAAINELERKAHIVAAGLDEFSAAERLAWQWLSACGAWEATT